jgi:hypothetical protein
MVVVRWLVVAAGLVLGPVVALWAFLESPCGPDSTADVCVLTAAHATAVLFPLVAGPVAAVATLVLALVLGGVARRRAVLAGALLVVATVAVPAGIVAVAPRSYPSAYEPR